MLISDLVGRDVAILGMGREGIAAWRYLRERLPDQHLTLYSEAPPGADCPAELLTSARNDGGPAASRLDTVHIGPLAAERLQRHAVLVRSPGVSPYRTPLREARAAGVAVTSGTNLWLAANPGARTLCITGTKGKSTTTALLHHLLVAAGARAAVAGNIGVPLIACDARSADWWVVELSSYQICDLDEPPWLALLLNLSDEHLDWHGSAERYRRDKLRLASLAPAGRLVANAGQPALVEALASRPDTRWFNQPGVLEVRDGTLFNGDQPLPPMPGAPGSHNLENLAGALTVCDFLGLRPDDLAGVLADFRGLQHRQYALGTLNGLRFVDDSLSTTPVATLAALEALGEVPVTVLVGGLDRGIDWSVHSAAFAASDAHAFIGLPDSGASIISGMEQAGLAPPGGLHEAQNLPDAVRLACELTPVGGTVLLSPGAPSFPVYRDYRERARAFAAAAGFPAEDDETAGPQG